MEFGFFDWLMVVGLCAVLFWKLTLLFGACGAVGGVGARFLVSNRWRWTYFLIGALLSIFLPRLCGFLLFSGDETMPVADRAMAMMAFAYAGGVGAFLGFSTSFLLFLRQDGTDVPGKS